MPSEHSEYFQRGEYLSYNEDSIFGRHIREITLLLSIQCVKTVCSLIQRICIICNNVSCRKTTTFCGRSVQRAV